MWVVLVPGRAEEASRDRCLSGGWCFLIPLGSKEKRRCYSGQIPFLLHSLSLILKSLLHEPSPDYSLKPPSFSLSPLTSLACWRPSLGNFSGCLWFSASSSAPSPPGSPWGAGFGLNTGPRAHDHAEQTWKEGKDQWRLALYPVDYSNLLKTV